MLQAAWNVDYLLQGYRLAHCFPLAWNAGATDSSNCFTGVKIPIQLNAHHMLNLAPTQYRHGKLAIENMSYSSPNITAIQNKVLS